MVFQTGSLKSESKTEILKTESPNGRHEDVETQTESRNRVGGRSKSKDGSIIPLPRELLDRLSSLGFAIEADHTGERFKLIFTKTNLVVGVKGFLWSPEELERATEIWESYAASDESGEVSQDSQSIDSMLTDQQDRSPGPDS